MLDSAQGVLRLITACLNAPCLPQEIDAAAEAFSKSQAEDISTHGKQESIAVDAMPGKSKRCLTWSTPSVVWEWPSSCMLP